MAETLSRADFLELEKFSKILIKKAKWVDVNCEETFRSVKFVKDAMRAIKDGILDLARADKYLNDRYRFGK